MKIFKTVSLFAIISFFAFDTFSQGVGPPWGYNNTNSPIISESVIGGSLRSLREGTNSNRTFDGSNNPAGSSPKTRSFADLTSFDSKFYDGKSGTVTTVAGSTTITATSSPFASADIGKTIEVLGATSATVNGSIVNNLPLTTTITGYINPNQVTLAIAPSITNSTAVTARFGFKPAYTEGHYSNPYGNSIGNFEMNYRLLFPFNYNPTEPYDYPLIIMLHGAGERGNCWRNSCYGNQFNQAGTGINYRNNDANLTIAGQAHLEAVYDPTTGSNGKKAENPTLHPHAWPGFVLFPQNESNWFETSQSQAMTIIDLIVQKYNIDPDRIFVHGISLGSEAVWNVASARPDLFAGILPISATIDDSKSAFQSPLVPTAAYAGVGPYPESNTGKLKGLDNLIATPIWIFQGGVDTNPTPSATFKVMNKLRAAGALVRYKEYATIGHACWNNAYAEPDFFSWMLKQNKRNIAVLYGDTTLCPTNSDGVKLALSNGFLAYQWEKDGAIIAGASTSRYTATTPGSYRARFSRINANPSESQWNLWSNPVVVKESAPVVPLLTAVATAGAIGTSHLPDINGGNIVRINGTTTQFLKKDWYVNDILNTTNTNFPASNNLDTANYTLRTIAGKVTLKTTPLNGCPSLFSNSIYVTTSAPTDLITPVNPFAVSTGPGTIQLFWTDNTPNETGFEVYRKTSAASSYDFFKLLNQGSISFTDSGLTPGTSYTYQLRAVNNTAVSLYTANIVVVVPTDDTQAPSVPQGLTVVSRTTSSITLKWTASTDNVGLAGYEIYNGAGTVVGNTTNTNFVVTIGISANNNYFFTVKAKDLSNNFSSSSSQVSTTTSFNDLQYTHSIVNVGSLGDYGNKWANPEYSGRTTGFVKTNPPLTQLDFFNIKYEGYIKLSAGTYQFRVQSSQGSRLFIGGDNVAAFPFVPVYAQNPAYNPLDPNSVQFFVTGGFDVPALAYSNDGSHGCILSPLYATDSAIPSWVFNGTDFKPLALIWYDVQGSECLTVQYQKTAGAGTFGWTNLPTSVLTTGTTPSITAPAAPVLNNIATTTFNSISLSWNTVASVDYYEIWRQTNVGGATYQMVATSPTNSFVNTGLTPSTGYFYKVKSVSNTNGSSALSNQVFGQTAPDAVAPTAPSAVTVQSSSYTNAAFTWTGSTDNVAVVGYEIFADGNLLGTSTTLGFSTTALAPGTPYVITVKAYDFAGNKSALSAPAAPPLTTTGSPTFYCMPASDISVITNWGSNTDGSGAVPPSFSYDGQKFIINSPQTISNQLTIGGGSSLVEVADGVTLTVSQPLTGKLKLGNGSNVIISGDYPISFDVLDPTSTVTLSGGTTIVPAAKYGNLVLNGTGLKTIPAGTLEVVGNLSLADGVGLKGAASNGTNVKVTGNITANNVAIASSDNRVSLQFVGIGAHTITATSDQAYSKITVDAGGTVTLNSSANTLTLGTLNGGGLSLANGSTLALGNNNLVLTGVPTVNSSGSTGEISINNANIQFATTSTTASNFYFATGNNQVQNFTLQTAGTTNIKMMVEVYDRLTINSGTLNAGGFVTLKSSATASASIPQIVTGLITGNVSVERYVAPKVVYRYLSSPVAGVTVANWQNYFHITGNFTGANNESVNSSLFFYNETTTPQYNPYPASGGNNSAPILVGKGYAAFMRATALPVVVNTGVPNQGQVTFTLTGGTAGGNNTPGNPSGYNLIGNPYASDIVWGNTGWTSTNVGNTIWVRENIDGVSDHFLTWDKSLNGGAGGGTLPGGKIPAGQAFWVQTTSLTGVALSVNESAKTTAGASSNNNFFRTEGTVFDQFNLVLTKGNLNDHAYVTITDDGNDKYESERDGAKRANAYFNLSTASSDNFQLTTNNLSNTFCDKVVPIVIKPGEGKTTLEPGTYTLQFDNLDAFSLADIELVDAYLNTTTKIKSNNPSYQVVVNQESGSYLNRISLKLTRPEIANNNVISVDKNLYCRSEQNAVVSIQNSQSGVAYEAINEAATAISTKVVGSGSTIQLLVPIKDLPLSQTIKVRSSFSGCTAVTLANSKIITISEAPALTINNMEGCIGSTIDVMAGGTGKTYQWFNENAGKSFSETGNTLSIKIVNSINSYHVTALNEAGCKSEQKNFLVLADSTFVPKINITANGVLETLQYQDGMQWLLNGAAINGATASQFHPEKSGSYSVKAKKGFCMQESTTVDYVVTGLEGDGSTTFSLVVYPNPSETGGKFTLLGSSTSTNGLQLQMSDLVGKEVLTRPVTFEEYTKGLTLETSLPSGVYIVLVSQNGKVVHQKIAIQ
jgi:chitodextrinase/predicted esterase